MHSDAFICVMWFIHVCLLQNIVSFIGLFCKRDLFDMTEWMLQGYVSISHVTETNESRYTHEWVMIIISQIWMSCASMMQGILVVTYMYIHIDLWSYHNYERVISHIWSINITHIGGDVRQQPHMSHMWMSRVAYVHESCRIFEWVISQIWRSRVKHMNAWCNTYEFVLTYT